MYPINKCCYALILIQSVLHSIGCEDGIVCHVILKPTTLNKIVKFLNFPVSFTFWSVRALGRMMAVLHYFCM